MSTVNSVNMSGFTKLWSEITDSSIWNEDDKTRIVWVTMLARMGPDSMVRASLGGLAHLARVTKEDCEKAIETLSNPDPDSRSSDFEGRRIERVEGGFHILNGVKYREARTQEERREYMREYMREYRKRKQGVNPVKKPLTKLAEAEEEADLKKEKNKAPTEKQIINWGEGLTEPSAAPADFCTQFHAYWTSEQWVTRNGQGTDLRDNGAWKSRLKADWITECRKASSRKTKPNGAAPAGKQNFKSFKGGFKNKP